MKMSCKAVLAVVFLSALMAPAGVCSADAQKADEAFRRARDANRQRNHQAALAALEGFFQVAGASVGDARLDPARKMYVQSALAVAAELERGRREAEAATFLVSRSKVPALGETADELRTRARDLLSATYDAAKEKSDHERAVEVAEAWTAVFREEAPLAPPEQLTEHRLAALAETAKKPRGRLVLAELRKLKEQGVTEEQLAAAGLSEPAIVLEYAAGLFEQKWYRQAASHARDQLAAADLDEPRKKEAEKLLERSLAAYAAACLKLGNVAMIEEAVGFYDANENAAKDPTKLAGYRKQLEALKAKVAAPKELKFPGPFVEGGGTWTDDGAGFFIDGTVRIGNHGSTHGGADKSGNVEVRPGFVLRGGTIRVSSGKLAFRGTPEKPVILRNVRIECELAGTVTAVGTIFVDCTFQKAGGWFMGGGYSSKWDFADCLVVGSEFHGLSKVDYGIKWRRSTFVNCSFPQRMLNEDSAKDTAAQYRGEWTTIEDCLFENCKLPPSVVWGSDRSIFRRCTISEPSKYTSSTSLPVSLAVPKGETAFVAAIKAETTHGGGRGQVGYTISVVDDSPRPSPLWQFVPELPD